MTDSTVHDDDAEFVAGPVWRDDADKHWTAEIQIIGGHEVAAEVYAGSEDDARLRQQIVLAALSPSTAEGVLRSALEKIAGCDSHHPDDVVAIARAALAGKSGEGVG